jgi:thiol-disulfide isomerase/thioredoxin
MEAIMRTAAITFFLLCLISTAKSQEPEQAPSDEYQAPVRPVIPHHEEMVGQSVTFIKFAGEDGKEVGFDSYRGRPLLIDFWATWCAPCLAALPSLNRIYGEFKSKGLEMISFDQEEEEGDDRDAAAARSYLAQHHYEWKNFHDTDRKVAKALQCDGLPLVVLIDANGNIVFYDFGSRGGEATLRRAIAGLGPEFASPASSEKRNPGESSASPDEN